MEYHYLRPLFDPAVIHVYAADDGSSYAAALDTALGEGAFAGRLAHWRLTARGSFPGSARRCGQGFHRGSRSGPGRPGRRGAIMTLEHAAQQSAREL
ncbi:MAG TPA: hypothetical protein VF928_10805 [Usitatibacteraceae bacterium]